MKNPATNSFAARFAALAAHSAALAALLGFAAFASANAYAVTATKAYVDSRDAAIATAATNYTDAAVASAVAYTTGVSNKVEAAQSAAAANAAALSAHASATDNPHGVTAAQLGALTAESDPTVPAWAKSATKPTYTASEVGTYTTSEIDSKISAATPSDYETVKSNASTALSTANANTQTLAAKANTADLAKVATSGSYADLSNKPTIPTVPTKVSAFSNDSGYITQTTADSTYFPKASGDAWSSYWDGDDVRVTVTNYDSAVHLPTLYLEQRTNDTASASDDAAFRTVWREMTHWDAFLGSTWNWEDATWQGFDSWRASLSSALDEKADRAWGFYDSHTGEYAPDGYTSISSSNVMICAGASYQKTATATCDIWVLTANEPYEPTGVSTNGGFQIKDADGNVQFEIVKGDKATVKAQANGVTVDSSTTPNTLVVTYNIVSEAAPTGEVCLELANAQWKSETDSDCPATVTWSGSSGAWVARITPTASTDKCFFKATYATGGDTYVNNRCAVGMSQLVLNGTTYNLGTATIDGHTVLTLTPAN